MSSPSIPSIVGEHATEAGFLWTIRARLEAAPHVRLFELNRHDNRIAAQLDGLAVAGEDGWRVCVEAVDTLSAGAAFTAMASALESGDAERAAGVIARGKDAEAGRVGIAGAFAWVDSHKLQGIVAGLLNAGDPPMRALGIAACLAHRIHPSAGVLEWLGDESPLVRGQAYQTVGAVGRLEHLPACLEGATGGDDAGRFWAARSAVLLGERDRATSALVDVAFGGTPESDAAFTLAVQAGTQSAAHDLLRSLSRAPEHVRLLIRGSGVAGDPAYVGWLMAQMSNPATARLAYEAFSLITAADPDGMLLVQSRPEAFESAANDDPEDPNVAIDDDEDLPWPDPVKVAAWWHANQHRFHKGTRYFMGQPVTKEHCIHVLKTGYQRQRILAAQYLCLLERGTPLFNTSAPAWRQQRLLAKM